MVPWVVTVVASLVALLRGVTTEPDIQLMLIISLGSNLLNLQCILGPMRCHSQHWVVQYGAMAAYHLPFLLSLYVLRAQLYLSEGSPYKWYLGVFSCLFTVFCTTPTNMRAYNLSDGPLRGWCALQSILYVQCLIWRWTTEAGQDYDVAYKVLLSCGCLIYFATRVIQSHTPVTILARNVKSVADYMKSLQRSSFFNNDHGAGAAGANNISPDSCMYPFMMTRGQWITINGLLQRGTQQDPNIYLSYSFFKLLARRYFGFACVEEGNGDVKNFMMNMLQPDDCTKAFELVEMQLNFLHDYIYTSYSKMMFDMDWYKKVPDAKFFVGVIVGTSMSKMTGGQVSMLAFTVGLLLLMFLLSLLLHHIQFLASDWCKVWYTYEHYSTGRGYNQSRLECFVRFLMGRTTWLQQPYWKKKIGQYSLMEDYDRCSAKKAFIALFNEIVLSEWPPSFIKHHPVEEEDVSVPDSVRRSVASALQGINGPPTNGSWCLQSITDIDFDDWAWTLRQETHTHTILIWHIATFYCDCDMPSPVDKSSSDYKVATTLSRYCAYLVAFLPEFLPEHSLDTNNVFQQVLHEAKIKMCAAEEEPVLQDEQPFLQEESIVDMSMGEDRSRLKQLLQDAKRLLGGQSRMSADEKRTKLQGFQLPEDVTSLTTFEKVLKLGKKLKNHDNRWTVMAKFWAETTLYVAPSDNVTAHIEHLVKGGEFVTHLWAFLSNAGILKRAAEEWSPPQPEPVASDIVGGGDELRLRRSQSLPTF